MTDTDFIKHTVNTDALATIGNLITPDETRDAIHLAVYPVEAGDKLYPGCHVSINDEGRAVPSGETVGIVDPFLADSVIEGQWFWLVVYPRQISSLHHVWEHPAFPASAFDTKGSKTASEAWLREYIDRLDISTYDEDESAFDIMMSAVEHSGDRGYVTIGTDGNGQLTPEFWVHAENYFGKKFSEHPDYFSCAC